MVRAAYAWNYARGHSYIGIADLGSDPNNSDLKPFSGNTYIKGNFQEHLAIDASHRVSLTGSGANPFSGLAYFGSIDEYLPQYHPSDLDCDSNNNGFIESVVAGHGTAVTGVIGASAENSLGMKGVCRHCPLTAARFGGHSACNYGNDSITGALLLRSHLSQGTEGYSTAEGDFTRADTEDLERYLDVTRAELVFARGVILVEGDAERFLIPAFSEDMGISLDEHGVSVCSVAGTNFQPYVKLLCTLGIPFCVITDYDEVDEEPRAYNRALKLVRIINSSAGDDPEAMIEDIEDKETWDEAFAELQNFGIFVNSSTLETELFEGDYAQEIIDTLREHNFSTKRQAILDVLESRPEDVEAEELLKMIEQVGKGRFAQRLAARVLGKPAPKYIVDAIKHVIGLV